MNNKLNIIIPIYIGTLLEWYDFSIFAFLTPIISELFFSNSNQYTATLFTYAVFGIGFFARPLGGVFFGQLADRYGRKKSMLLSMVMLTIATAMIGLLPTYKNIGIFAPLIMVLLRLIQGFCIGGESTGAAIYIIEMYPVKSRGVLTSFMWSAAGVGMLLGSFLTTLLFQFFSTEQIKEGLWRLPFLMGLFTAVFGIYFRKKIPETRLFQNTMNNNNVKKEKLSLVITNNKKAIWITASLYALSSIITYLLFVFMPAYITQNNDIDLKTASLVTTIALSIVTCLVPFSGYLSDHFGRKFCLYAGSIGFYS